MLHLQQVYNQRSSILLLIVWCYKRQYTDKILTLRKSSGADELRNLSHFHIQKLQFRFQYFAGSSINFVGTTNGMLVGLHVQTKLQKSITGEAPPPPPPLPLTMLVDAIIIQIHVYHPS